MATGGIPGDTDPRIYWISADGQTINLSTGIFSIRWGTASGWSGYTGTPETINLPDFSAEQLTRVKYQRRTPQISILISAGTRDELDYYIDMLISAFSADRLGRMYIQTASGLIYIDCITAAGSPEISYNSVSVATAKIQLIAPDPRYYADSVIVSDSATTNPGNAPVACTLVANAETISNTTTGKTITAAPEQSIIGLTIDTTPGHIRVTDSGGNNMIHKISMNSDLSGFQIIPGENVITGAQYEYRPAWRGKVF